MNADPVQAKAFQDAMTSVRLSGSEPRRRRWRHHCARTAMRNRIWRFEITGTESEMIGDLLVDVLNSTTVDPMFGESIRMHGWWWWCVLVAVMHA